MLPLPQVVTTPRYQELANKYVPRVKNMRMTGGEHVERRACPSNHMANGVVHVSAQVHNAAICHRANASTLAEPPRIASLPSPTP
eukprot:6341105-Pyramimonas_sp.AAC.2